MATSSTQHPCLSCGACCASFRASFHWTESNVESHGVPLVLSEAISPHQNAMLGTLHENPRCIALAGVVGEEASCQIYVNRPNCCRVFRASFENGVRHDQCDEARAGKGLARLQLTDWLPVEASILKQPFQALGQGSDDHGALDGESKV